MILTNLKQSLHPALSAMLANYTNIIARGGVGGANRKFVKF